MLAASGVGGILGWADEVEDPQALGLVLSEAHLAESEEAQVLSTAGRSPLVASKPAPIQQLVAGFVRGRAYTRGQVWLDGVLRSALTNHGVQTAAMLAQSVVPEPGLWTLLDAISDDLAQTYWSRVFLPYLDLEAAEVAVPRLLAAGRNCAAISLAAMAVDSIGTEFADAGCTERTWALCVRVMKSWFERTASGPQDLADASIQYSVDEIPLFVEAHAPEGEDVTPLVARWEWEWLPALEHSGRGPRALYRALADDPAFFVQLLSLVYRGSVTADSTKPDPAAPVADAEEQRHRVDRGWRLLQSWNIVPGLDLTTAIFQPKHTTKPPLLPVTPAVAGSVDAAKLRSWVDRARDSAKSADRARVGDVHIGLVLAHAPADADGTWPCQPVRELIESMESQSIERHFAMGVQNRRGDHFMGRTGDAERQIRDAFLGHAERVRLHYPRTASVLRGIAASYDHEAKERDREGIRREFVD